MYVCFDFRVCFVKIVFFFFPSELYEKFEYAGSTIDLWLFKKIYALFTKGCKCITYFLYFSCCFLSKVAVYGGVFSIANAISRKNIFFNMLIHVTFLLPVFFFFSTGYNEVSYFFWFFFFSFSFVCLFLLIYLSLCSACMCKKHCRKWFFSWLFRRFFYVLYTNIQVMQFISFFFSVFHEIHMPVRPTYLVLSANMEYISSLLFISLCIYRVCPRSITGSYILLAHIR